MSMENWRPVVGWEGLYEVSDHGRVRSLDRSLVDTIGRPRTFRGRLLNPRRGYVYATLNLVKHGRPRAYNIHRLVLEAFVGKRPNGLECRHKNGNPRNNHISNIEWSTHIVNCADRLVHGTAGAGEAGWSAKLSNDDVAYIRGSIATPRELAARFGVGRAHICAIRANRTRVHG